ncbi:MAG: WecB/TagA/CpsF family glycosyltransferase [Candidatus Uhrbacteria bacterium]|nr:WecB/TagA/CpsF family glycosyltransferase [Patescibacteria group bacterium]MBU1906721.1 WecB/TagA/CpsF family glycosyltransferase [Patescibacteria group bacterium]
MINILGVNISTLNKSELKDALADLLESDRQHYVVTPNPEMLVAAQKDSEFQDILNGADIAIADGVGLQYAATSSGQNLPRITGNDLLKMLAALCTDKNKKIMLLGGEKEDVAKKSADLLLEEYPTLQVDHDPAGPVYKLDDEWHMNPAVIQHIKEFEPAVLLVAFGHGKQEKWIRAFLSELPSVKLAAGIGGAFDYLSGSVPRAPRHLQTMGLEWAYRLYKEPKRLGRIWTAVVVFPFCVIYDKIKSRKQ